MYVCKYACFHFLSMMPSLSRMRKKENVKNDPQLALICLLLLSELKTMLMLFLKIACQILHSGKLGREPDFWEVIYQYRFLMMMP